MYIFYSFKTCISRTEGEIPDCPTSEYLPFRNEQAVCQHYLRFIPIDVTLGKTGIISLLPTATRPKDNGRIVDEWHHSAHRADEISKIKPDIE